ncbi:MAG: D-alanine--D-alanine ligase [Eubacterium sp.]|nr:D-alanine--D-alanine ligase [Eubacterium sp.]
MNKEKLALLFGGQSSEHEVSCVSVVTVASALNRDKYDITFIGITKDGHWILVEDESTIANREWEKTIVEAATPEEKEAALEKLPRAIISPDTSHKIIIKRNGTFEERPIDIAFPVLHGLYGEDGTIQGLFELAHIPYVGCGLVSSAVTMDKFFTKVIADSIGVDQAKFVGVRDFEVRDRKTGEDAPELNAVVERIEKERQYPVFVKPSNAGSSVGVTKAHNREELIKGLKIAADNDKKILVEEAIVGREIECAVFGFGAKAFATGVGEILAAAEFYDYDAKYNNEESRTVLDPELPEGKREEIRKTAVDIYRACDCFGLARVDFFLEEGTNRVVFNEINAIPGHTSISMYPMLMERAGHPMSEYVESLLEMAKER